MFKALYYPHTDIGNPRVIKNALLLWDTIETIIPRKGWSPKRIRGNKLLNEATDLVVSRRIPNMHERKEAHDGLEELTKSGILNSLLSEMPPGWHNREYLIYPDKFLDRTWDLLKRGRIAYYDIASQDYGVPPSVGLLMMSLLANACAGTQVQKVTDRVDAYSWLSNLHARLLARPMVNSLDVSQVAPSYDRLVTLTMEVLDGGSIPLQKLVDFRKREIKQGGGDFTALRHRYLNALHEHIKRVGKEARSENDVAELNRQFKEAIRQDVTDLKSELRIASLKTLFSKEVAISALILSGCLISPVAGLTALATNVGGVGVIPLAKAAVEYRGARRTIIQKHITSWLYLASQSRIQKY